MKVVLRTDGPIRRWHKRVGERLAAAGHTLVVSKTPGRSLPTGLHLLLALERRLYGDAAALFDALGEPVADEDGDLVLEVRYDARAGERALAGTLLARRVPYVEIADATGRALAAGLPAVEAPDILACGLDHVLARTAQLVVTAVGSAATAASLQAASAPLPAGARFPAPVFGARTLATKLASRLRPAAARLPPWRIAIRSADPPDAAPAQAWTEDAFTPFAHDGLRFEADPFLISHAGRTCLFYEDFPFGTRRGVIAMRELGAEGWSSPRVVLDEPFHLSYPHLFVWDGTVYMLPEAAAAGCIRLYRADPFPDRFVPDRVLVEGVETGDATLVAHEGHWWLFATLAGDGGSSWDALVLFHAPHPFGPWTPHAANPVLIDAGAARPAGNMWHEDGTLMRVAQDCRTGYGKGLSICRVDRLDAAGYAQTVVARLSPPEGLAARGVHTLNRAAGFEVIDLA